MTTEATCDDQQAAYLEGDRTAVAHVATCPTCAAQRADLDSVRRLLGDPSLWVDPSHDLEARVLEAVRLDGLADASATSPPPPDPAVTNVTPLGAHRSRRRATRRWLPPIAAAAVAAILSGIVVSRLDRPPPPDYVAALAPTDLAGGATARAELRDTPSGVEIRLDVEGLARPPDGGFYAAWLEGPRGLVAIGTFHTGSEVVVLWSGIVPERGAAITVTREPDDGNPASSGQRVFAGVVR